MPGLVWLPGTSVFGYRLHVGNLVSFGYTWERYNTVYGASWLFSSDHKMIFNILSTEGRCNQPDKAVSRWIKHVCWQAIHQWNPNPAEFAVYIVANFITEMLTHWELDWKKRAACCRCWQCCARELHRSPLGRVLWLQLMLLVHGREQGLNR